MSRKPLRCDEGLWSINPFIYISIDIKEPQMNWARNINTTSIASDNISFTEDRPLSKKTQPNVGYCPGLISEIKVLE